MSDDRDRPLHEVIGGILSGFVKAQEMASLAAIDYIERLGFIPEERHAMTHTASGTVQDLSIGQMRLVYFRYIRQGEDGKDEQVVMSVPLLSLVSIPLMRIRKASTEFMVELGSMVTAGDPEPQAPQAPRTSHSTTRAALEEDTEHPAVIADMAAQAGLRRAELRVRLPAMARDRSVAQGTDLLRAGMVRIQMDIEGSDFPVGIQKLLHVSGISSTFKVPVSEEDSDTAPKRPVVMEED